MSRKVDHELRRREIAEKIRFSDVLRAISIWK